MLKRDDEDCNWRKRVGYIVMKKEIGRRKKRERAKKWRECALIIRFVSDIIPDRFMVSASVAMVLKMKQG